MIDYAKKYSNDIDEYFKIEMRSADCVNNDYDFTGVATVAVYSINTAQMHDYDRSRLNGSRYGELENLGTITQELILTQDKSFTFIIDRRDLTETQMALEAGEALNRQIREVVKPLIDKYRFTQMAINAGHKPTPIKLTKTNIYELITTATELLDEAEIPYTDRFLIAPPETFKLIKQSNDIILNSDIGENLRLNGTVALLDGMKIIQVPKSRLPENIGFLVGHPQATTSPIKLEEYKIHENPPGISGYLAEGRILFDAFILNNKRNALYYQQNITTTTPSTVQK